MKEPALRQSPMTEPQDTGDPQLQLAVEPLPVRVVDVAGESFAAEVFLRLASDRHEGPETLEDRLNDPSSRFLPCRVAERTILLHLATVAYLEHDGVLPEAEHLRSIGARPHPVELVLISGEELAGDMIYLLPSERSRLSDLFNQPGPPFLLMTEGNVTRYVSRDAVSRVRF
jgi:hypothetical protein